MNDIVIRDAVQTDAVGIAIVQAYTWLTTYSGLMPDEVLSARVSRVPEQVDYFAEQIALGRHYFVAECDGTVVGFASDSPSRDEEYHFDGEIQAIYVLQSFHRRMIGRGLFEHCVRKLRSEGFDQMIVNCLDGNPALGFYLRMGGEIVGERKDTIRGGYVICEKIIRFNIEKEGSTCES